MGVRCIRCKKPLRVEKSVERGVGPVCFRKIKAEVCSKGGDLVQEEGVYYVKYPLGIQFRLVTAQLELFGDTEKEEQV